MLIKLSAATRLPHVVDWNPAGVQYGDTMAVVGGNNGSVLLDTVYLFDFRTNGWLLLPNRLSEAKADVTAFTVSKSVFRKCD